MPCGHNCSNLCFESCNDNDCRVKIKKDLLCGHSAQVECSKDILKEICCFPCQKILPCGHKCRGDCDKCFNQTLHMRCMEKCKKILICGHECQGLCGENCPPCKKKCTYKCCNADCPLTCGEKCIQCKSHCKNNCPHYKCKRLCGEICDVSCDLPCLKEQKCKHPCLGVCGEVCPDLCKVCKKDNEAFQILFGNEDDEKALFYQLQCKHIFEVSGLDKYMLIEAEKMNGAIKYITCPKCKTPITQGNRYQKYIKTILYDINQVKDRINQTYFISDESIKILSDNCQNKVSILQDNKELIEYDQTKKSVKKFIEKMPKEIENFAKQKKAFKTKKDYDSLQNHIDLIDVYLTLLHYTIKNINGINNYELTLFKMHVVKLGKVYLFDYENRYDDLIWIEIKRKLDSLLYYKEYHLLERMKSSSPTAREFKSKIAKTKFHLDDNELYFYKKELQKLAIPTRKDQIEIIKALNMTAGHVFKCPKGHYYVIGECGGAMEESKCIECKETIGGNNHTLSQGNRHTGDLDGSKFAAYSEGAQQELIRRFQNNLRID